MRRHPAHGPVVPRRGTDEVEEPLMGGVHLLGIATHQGDHGLNALALRTAEQAHGVDRERSASFGVAEHLADPRQVALDATNPGGVHEDHGTSSDHAEIVQATSRSAFFASDRNDRGFQAG